MCSERYADETPFGLPKYQFPPTSSEASKHVCGTPKSSSALHAVRPLTPAPITPTDGRSTHAARSYSAGERRTAAPSGTRVARRDLLRVRAFNGRFCAARDRPIGNDARTTTATRESAVTALMPSEAISLALAASIYPPALAAVIALGRGTQVRLRVVLLVFGAFFTVLLTGSLMLLLFTEAGASSSSSARTIGAGLYVAGGVALVVLGFRLLNKHRRHPRRTRARPKPTSTWRARAWCCCSVSSCTSSRPRST